MVGVYLSQKGLHFTIHQQQMLNYLVAKKKKKNILKRFIRFKRMTWNTFQEKNSTMQTFQPSWAQKQNIGKHFCLFVASCDPNAFF
jgi:hypothetical protein